MAVALMEVINVDYFITINVHAQLLDQSPMSVEIGPSRCILVALDKRGKVMLPAEARPSLVKA